MFVLRHFDLVVVTLRISQTVHARRHIIVLDLSRLTLKEVIKGIYGLRFFRFQVECFALG